MEVGRRVLQISTNISWVSLKIIAWRENSLVGKGFSVFLSVNRKFFAVLLCSSKRERLSRVGSEERRPFVRDGCSLITRRLVFLFTLGSYIISHIIYSLVLSCSTNI